MSWESQRRKDIHEDPEWNGIDRCKRCGGPIEDWEIGLCDGLCTKCYKRPRPHADSEEGAWDDAAEFGWPIEF